MKRLSLTVAATAIACLTLSACGSEYTGPASVISHRHEPERSYYQPMPVGKVTVLMPETDDEDWIIVVRPQSGSYEEVDITVNQFLYDSIKDGDVVQLQSGELISN